MSGIDWVVLAIVAVSALLGLMRGFVGVLASLAAWVLAGWVAFRHGDVIGVLLAADGEPGPGEVFAGYALGFLAVMVAVALVGWFVRRLVASAGLSGVDRALGLGIGLARGAFVACALLLLLGLTALPREPEWRASPVLPWFLPGAQWLRAWLPEWVAAQVDLGDGAAADTATDDAATDDAATDGTEPALPAPVAS